jgi:hypothetical protein
MIPTRHILASIIVAIHDKNGSISAIIDHQLSGYFKEKSLLPNKSLQMTWFGRLLIPYIHENGWRVHLPITVDTFLVWISVDLDHSKSISDQGEFDWFKQQLVDILPFTPGNT